MPNRLAKESSPYLLQHANNPVDWYPWGPESLNRAKLEDKPILLSIGYSACHWCHVMEHESFENQEIADLMNKHFVNIKVDREERPDLDSIYMQAVQAMTGHGGWPLTVFLTSDAKPFFGGTYFPPSDKNGLHGFSKILRTMSEAYANKRGDIELQGVKLVSHLRQEANASTDDTDPLTEDLLVRAYEAIKSQFDSRDGGFGVQPKFPQAMTLEFLLRHHYRTKDPQALSMVELTLKKMACGGIYDQLGGGFHRYSTDAFWMTPHFEKMLYDNALLSRVYLHAFQITGNSFYRRIIEETLGYLTREMLDPNGGFYSAQDADSDGMEGKYYVWQKEEIVSILGKDHGDKFCEYFGVTADGNFDGSNILFLPTNRGDVSGNIDTADMSLASEIEASKEKLLSYRQERESPATDDKILTGWNAMVIRALAEAGMFLGRDDYIELAKKSASFLLNSLVGKQNRLIRMHRNGKGKGKGYLEDYALLIDAFIALYESTLDGEWLSRAKKLADCALEIFWYKAQKLFYDTGKDHEVLIFKPRDIFDNAIPCGSSVMFESLQRLAVFTGEQDYLKVVEPSIHKIKDLLNKYPTGFPHWLCGLDLYLSKTKEIVIIGPLRDGATEAMLRVVYSRYIPNRVLVAGVTGDAHELDIPIAKGKTMIDDNPTAYICEDYVCGSPVTDISEFEKQLGA